VRLRLCAFLKGLHYERVHGITDPSLCYSGAVTCDRFQHVFAFFIVC
jgi:hypothetical protein